MSQQRTSRSISQVLRRHGIGSLVYLDEHSLIARVSDFRASVDVDVNQRRLHRHFVDRLRLWRDNNGRIIGVTKPEDITEKEVVAMRPVSVTCVPYGEWYACVKSDCGVMHKKTDVGFSGRCRKCRGPLDQLRWVYYHHCGSLTELVPQAKCPTHGMALIAFEDTRKLTTSSWVCRGEDCNFRRLAFYPPCQQSLCRASDDAHKKYQIAHWRDSWVYYSQGTDFVNLDDDQARPFVNSDFGQQLVHQAVLGEISAGGRALERRRQDAGGSCPKPDCGTKIQPGWKLCPQCGSALPQLENGAPVIPVDFDAGRTTWAMLRDLEESRSAAESGFAGMSPYGIADIVLVNAFPLTHGLIGYTRGRADRQSWLRLFNRKEDKYVIYTDSIDTEAWMVQLSARAVVAWMQANNIQPSAGDFPNSEDENILKTWLIERIVGEDENVVGVVTPLLHTMSHVLLYSLATSCGLEVSSLGEMMMLDALAFAIYAGDSELGALTATFDQMLEGVMQGILEFKDCKFDPGCRHDDKGACVGCIHMPRGCERFNDALSRAYLFGGPVPQSPLLPPEVRGFLGLASGLAHVAPALITP